MSSILPTQAYELKLAPQPAPTSVLKYTGRDGVSELYRYDIEFTSPVSGIPMDQVVGRPAKFIIAPVDPNMDYLRKMFGENAEKFSKMPPAYTIHGVITEFDELATTADQTHYRVRLEPTFADLNRGVTSRLFQKQSVEEILTDTLRHYGYRAGVDFMFQLRGKYKRHEYVTQYHETTFAFIQRLCAQEGIWFRWEQKKDHAALVFGDDLDAYARKQRTVPYRRDSGLESSGTDAIKTLEKRTRRVPEAVRLHDYNHRQAGVSLLVEENAARADKSTNGIDYRWGEHYETPDEGRQIARRRHEEYLATQVTFKGTGNPFWLEAGEVMRVEPVPADAKHGIFITAVESSGGRSQSYWVTFEGIPSDRVYRMPIASIKRPAIDGILPARITSPGDYKYAYLTEHGWYVIKLPFDLDEWSPGGTSRPVRFAKPYSGDNYGHHFPLIDGAEVAIVFTDGHPDRPVIIGAMHDSLHPDLVNNLNHTRNIVRTAAQNELRMEDKEGVEHIHLMTPHQTSELNLGHMVDGDRSERGHGAELRTDGPAAVRGAKGVLITAEGQPGAAGQQLAMQDADTTLEQATQILHTLNDAANAAKALQADIDQQRVLIEQKLKEFQKPVIVATAPDGIGFASGQQMQLAARKQMFVTAGDGLDVGVMKRIAIAAGEALSLFAARLGIRIFAAKGTVQVQAQSDAMELMSMQDMTASSSDGEVIITGRKGVTLGDGAGAYIKLSGGKIILGSPAGEIELRGNLKVDDPDGGSFKFPTWSNVPLNDVKNATNFGFSE
ncbi:type VI secretion system Vgr family protein [Burkholderia pseudomultivorans]|uniref:Actin cross-linking toxin VgrG1 n=1 Tax=Burkholderia pseudomultivorans TaxID=1207504 RepID=A0ABU2E607_9BURK|nr:type VI secretion system Vgr family protein [Burkholderia pseudomultivorans]MDR8729185.1 Actin cross-linking toxin VgrG1 [Burkholderia pseudomultivorans]MDR8737769.1 Actin cross-linking toxin VgrG1 [Burkholderia pseudomultivorans]MDR8743957.1 Actin cross-linking toxin VgrG1 [Burkholderia pseudomultivorans]MDR8755282.1 Actin cross-linking toxin VgrG1 [Burkholderia pseudomultivorans]MDR8780407.1 Actin cross-linking toxin VgrG1 [Burkholderia pseudomultivorans]